MICAECDQPIPKGNAVQILGTCYCRACAKVINEANREYIANSDREREQFEREQERSEQWRPWREFFGTSPAMWVLYMAGAVVFVLLAIMVVMTQIGNRPPQAEKELIENAERERQQFRDKLENEWKDRKP